MAEKQCQWVYLLGSCFGFVFYPPPRTKIVLTAGLVNYCVHASGAYLKALEVARNINEKV